MAHGLCPPAELEGSRGGVRRPVPFPRELHGVQVSFERAGCRTGRVVAERCLRDFGH